MANSRKTPINQLRDDIDSLRRNYTGALTSANRAIHDGIEQLTEHELSAIKKHYETALSSLKTFKKGGSPQDMAMAQMELLQNTMDSILSNTRHSLSILESTRREVASQVRNNLSGNATPPDADHEPPTAPET